MTLHHTAALLLAVLRRAASACRRPVAAAHTPSRPAAGTRGKRIALRGIMASPAEALAQHLAPGTPWWRRVSAAAQAAAQSQLAEGWVAGALDSVRRLARGFRFLEVLHALTQQARRCGLHLTTTCAAPSRSPRARAARRASRLAARRWRTTSPRACSATSHRLRLRLRRRRSRTLAGAAGCGARRAARSAASRCGCSQPARRASPRCAPRRR